MNITPETIKEFCERGIRKIHVSVTKSEFDAWHSEMNKRLKERLIEYETNFMKGKVSNKMIQLSDNDLAIPLFLSTSFSKFLVDNDVHSKNLVSISFKYAEDFLSECETIIPLVFMKESKK